MATIIKDDMICAGYMKGKKDACQLTYGIFPTASNKAPGLFFYQMAPKEALQYTGVLSLVLHFQWTWIGLIAMDYYNGETFIQTVFPLFSKHSVCFAFIERLPSAQPLSLCSENCNPGTRKKMKEGEPFCCYMCIPCPEGKISEEQAIPQPLTKTHDPLRLETMRDTM